MSNASDSEQQAVAEDIERTKKRQYEIANYSALVSGGLISLVKLFSDDNIGDVAFYHVVVWSSIGNAFAASWFQIQLVASLQGFRTKLQRMRGKNDVQTVKAVNAKFWRDFPLFVFLLAMPLAAAGFAIWYAVGMSGLSWGLWPG